MKALAALLLSLEQIADLIEVSRTVFLDALKHHPELRQIIENGQSNTMAKAHQRAVVLSDKDPNMLRFLLQCKGKWRPTERIEHTGMNGAPIRTSTEVGQMSEEEQKARLAELRKMKEEAGHGSDSSSGA